MKTDSTPLLDRVDPGLAVHADLGRRAARFVFERHPNGDPPRDLVELAEAITSRAIRRFLEPLGATHDDVLAAFLAAAEAFGPHYRELFVASRRRLN